MQDDVRVTVVATGLNAGRARSTGGRDRDAYQEPQRRPHIQLINTGRRDGTTGMLIEDEVQPQPVAASGGFSLRRGSAEPVAAPATPAVADFGGNDSGYLDIPAFLRRQAD